MNEKIKILHIIWAGDSGGEERFLRDVTHYSDKNQFQHEACFLSYEGWISRQMAKNGINISCLGMRPGLSLGRCLKLIKIITEFRPHIIHSHNRNYLVNIILLFFPGIPKVYFEHGGLVEQNPKKTVAFYRYFGRFYDLILTNSGYLKNTIIKCTGIDSDKVKVFYIGIDPARYNRTVFDEKPALRSKLNIPEENKVIGTVARLVEAKGIDDFIKTASNIRGLDNKCTFIVVGEGDQNSALEKLASSLKIRIEFLGDREDVPELLGIFDIFLFTSKWNAFGIVTLEAMASSVPVLGFAIPGNKEIIESGGGGILIERRDHQQLAEITVDILSNKERYKKLSKEGYENVVKNFNIINNIKKLEGHYKTVARNRKSAADGQSRSKTMREEKDGINRRGRIKGTANLC